MSRYSYFKSELSDLFVISDETHKETFPGMDNEYNCSRIVRKLNTLTDENEELKAEKKEFLNDVVKLEKEWKRLSNNLRLTKMDWKYEELMHEKLEKENEELKNKIIHLEEDLRYYKSKSASCEEGLISQDRDVLKLKKENEQLKQENQGIQDKVMRLLDYVELKQCVTRTEIKKWLNGDVE